MGKYLVFSLLLLTSKCNELKSCYNDTHYKVNWNEANERFEEVDFDVGEPLIFIKLDNCEVKGLKFSISGRIVDDSTLINPNELLDNDALILLCNSNGTIKDTIVTTDRKGKFKTDFYPNKNDALIVKRKNDSIGIKYKIKDYK